MRYLTTILAFLLHVVPSMAQSGKIRGHVHEAFNNECIIFAEVTILGIDVSGLTDTNGDFSFPNIPIGTFDLKVFQKGSIDTVLTGITIEQDATTDISVLHRIKCEFQSVSERKCPHCLKKDKVIPIVYGIFTPKLARLEKQGKIIRGGPGGVNGCNPHWYCERDKRNF